MSTFELSNYNPLRNEENPENQWKKEIYRDLLQGICFYLIFAISFSANCSGVSANSCGVLLSWGRAAAFYLTMGFIMFCIVNPILACTLPTIQGAIPSIPEWVYQNLLKYIRIFMYVWGGIIFLGLMISVFFIVVNSQFQLGYGEKCGSLSSATGFFIFVVIVTLIIIGLCYCFVLSDAGYQAIDKAKGEIQNYGTMKEEKSEVKDETKKNAEQEGEKKENDVKLEVNSSKIEEKKPEDKQPEEKQK